MKDLSCHPERNKVASGSMRAKAMRQTEAKYRAACRKAEQEKTAGKFSLASLFKGIAL